MERASKPVRFTVTIDNPKLYNAARQLAVGQKKPLKTVMAEALRLWIEQRLREELGDQWRMAAGYETDREPAGFLPNWLR